MKKKRHSYLGITVLLIVGICCIAASLFFTGEDVKTISGVLIGVGAGLVGLSVSGLVARHLESKNPELEKQKEIEHRDERNTMIRNRAKAKAGDITQWLIIAIAYILIFISAPLWVILSVIAVLIAYNVIALYFTIRYQKEM